MKLPHRVVSFGECMLELQGQAFGTLQQTYGGDTLNTAVYLARCGARQGLRVDYATALGDDPLSAGMLQRWQADGLGTGLVRRLPGRLPGLYLIATSARDIAKHQDQLAALSLRLNAALPKRLGELSARLDALDRTRQTLGYAETLRRGYAVVWGDGAVVTGKDQAEAAQVLELEFHDGRMTPTSAPKKAKPTDPKPTQGSLF